MLKLSVVIITFNEERNIKRCLDSVVEFADEILVLDSFSVDQTKNIIQQYKFPIQLFEKQFSGYGDSKNFLEQKASSDFIFSIDADEEVDEKLRLSILQEKQNDFPAEIYSVKRLNNYCGKWIFHGGWNPDVKTRLWKKGIAYWDSAEVHETLVFKESAMKKRLQGDLKHYSYSTQQDHLIKIEKYSEKGALQLARLGTKFSFVNFRL